MDVRCEKCQTEYELDEARLKPGGVTVKCTNCGHMFKIRKRAITNLGAPPPSGHKTPRPESTFDAPAAGDRQWLIRLENGEQKSCRELSALQQWILAGVVTRESLISRTGKTWKRLGDIGELSQYFTLADQSRARGQRPSGPQAGKDVPGTMLGVAASSAVGRKNLPDEDALDRASTDEIVPRDSGRANRPSTSQPPIPASPASPAIPASSAIPAHRPASSKTPPMGSGFVLANNPATSATVPAVVPPGGSAGARPRPSSHPPPVPPKKAAPKIAPPEGNRATAGWAKDSVPPAIPPGARAEPAFGKPIATSTADDDDVLPPNRGSRSGMMIVIMALAVMMSAGIVIYLVAFRGGKSEERANVVMDAAVVATTPLDAAVPVITPVIDAAVVAQPSPIDVARSELGKDLEPRLREALTSLAGKDEAPTQAMRAHLASAIAQGMFDRAALSADRAEAEKLRKDGSALVLEAASDAQRAYKAAPTDATANLAMADVLRLQRKPAREVARYLDAAKTNAAPEWAREIAIAGALALVRDGKLDDAKAALTTIDQGDGKLETSGDVRARFRLAMIAHAQNRLADAKLLADQVIAAQPEHAATRALLVKLGTAVANTDPLPPEDSSKPSGPKPGPGTDAGGGGAGGGGGGGDSYDRLLAKANAAAESNCGKALELYAKALEQKPNGVEALTGMGYCHIDGKQFASAFSKFRAALAVSARYEPALWGVAEAYVQQGRKEQAVEALKAYLEVYPESAKAKKQLERLEASIPAPAPDGAGSGSG
jgi:predicted Zn finger-like uncharacterized protein